MTHFFPGGITENLLEQSLGVPGKLAEQLPTKRDVAASPVSRLFFFFCKGLSGACWLIKFPHGPAREKEQQGAHGKLN